MKRPLATAALVTALVLMGLLMCGDSPPRELFPDGEDLTLTGRVYDVQQRDGYGTRQLWIYLDVNLSYHLICQTDDSYRPRMGSLVQVTGQFESFSHGTNPGQFDQHDYYAALKIGGIVKNARITAVSSDYSVIKEALYSLKKHWKERLYRCFPEKEASILSAMLLGDKTQLDRTTKDLYQKNGIIHILSISGLHITLIGMGLYRLLRRMRVPVILAAAGGGLLLFLYGILTGMGVSAVRAICMYLVRMLGVALGRTYDMLTALGFAAILMLLGRPAYLGHAGFLLSFGSICGIGILLPVFSAEEDEEESGKRESLRRLALQTVKYIRKLAAPGCAVTLMTLPIQLYFYYEVPVYSLALNLLVLPFVGIVMTVGLVVMLLPGMGFVGQVDVLILNAYEWLCELFQELPFRMWNPGAPDNLQILIYYVLLLFAFLWRGGKAKKIFVLAKLIRGLAVAGALFCLGFCRHPDLSVTFLDVGQGDCICVQAGKEVYLFDCGSSKDKVGENILLPYLKHQGIRRLGGVFVSHPDKDHVSGILELLTFSEMENIRIDRLILPGIAWESRESEFAEILRAVEAMGEAKPQVIYMSRGDSLKSGEVSLTCLHPQTGSAVTESNVYSQCFLVEYGDFSMLLTGDVEGEGEDLLMRELLQREVDSIDILKVAHHGSRFSTGEELLALIKPRMAVISCGEDNLYGHPHKELLDRLEAVGCGIYRTPETGAVTISVSKRNMKIKYFLQ